MVKYLWLLKLACAVGYIVSTALLSMHKLELCLSHRGDCSLEATLSVGSAFQLPVCEKVRRIGDNDDLLLDFLLRCVAARSTVRFAARLQQLRVSEHNVSAGWGVVLC